MVFQADWEVSIIVIQLVRNTERFAGLWLRIIKGIVKGKIDYEAWIVFKDLQGKRSKMKVYFVYR